MKHALLASLFGGIACGIVGVWVILMHIPFVGIAMSHAAFAGAILGLLFHVDPLVSALAMCLAAAVLVGPMADKGDMDPNISIGIIFSFVLGIAFLGMGFIKGPKTEALRYIWGSILLVSGRDVLLLSGTVVLIVSITLIFHKEIQAVLFNRDIARAAGIPATLFFYLLLSLCGLTVTLNLNTIGGLLIFSLLISPPSAAYQLTYSLKTMYLLSSLFSVLSCLTGLLFSWLFDTPTGAVIIIASSLIFCVTFLFSPKKKVKGHETA